jgi:hypothetical protein
MEDERKEPKTYLNYGVLTGVVLIVLFVLYYVFGLDTDTHVAFIPALVFAVLIIVAQVNHAKSLDGNITYGNLFAAGFKATCAATGIYVVFLIIFLILAPGYKEHLLDFTRQKMVAKGLTSDVIDRGMASYRRGFTVFTIGGAIFADIVTGCIASLIGAAIPRKNPRPQSA